MNAPFAPTQLADKAMLVKLRRSMFNPSITDKDATSIVEVTTGVTRAGKFKKTLFADSSRFKQLQAAFNELYTYHQQHTLPWTDAGPRLLPAHLYFEYTEQMRARRAAADNALRMFAGVYDQEIQRDLSRLGNMGRVSDYPKDIHDTFAHDVQFMPVPTTGDFRVQISDEDRLSMESAIREAESAISGHIIEQLLTPLQHAAARLTEYKGEKGQKLYDSVLGNIMEAVERLPKLDISGDPRIAKAIEDTRRIAEQFDTNTLKEADEVRATAASQLKAQADNIAALFGGI